jgi:hypothetical protein
MGHRDPGDSGSHRRGRLHRRPPPARSPSTPCAPPPRLQVYRPFDIIFSVPRLPGSTSSFSISWAWCLPCRQATAVLLGIVSALVAQDAVTALGCGVWRLRPALELYGGIWLGIGALFAARPKAGAEEARSAERRRCGPVGCLRATQIF